MLSGIAILLAAVAFAVDEYIVTDRERVADNIEGVVRAFERCELDATLNYFSLNADCERAMAMIGVASIKPSHPFSLKDIQIELSNENSLATTHFRVNGSVLVMGKDVGHQATLWKVTWRKEAREWRITAIQQLDPLHETPIKQISRLGPLPCD